MTSEEPQINEQPLLGEQQLLNDQVQTINDRQASSDVAIDEDTILGFLHSKNFKERINAYAAVGRFPQYIPMLQNETMVPALEAALDALLAFPGPLKSDDVSKIFLQAAQSKTSIRSKVSSLIDRVAVEDRNQTIEALCSLLTNKNAKIVERSVCKLTEIIRAAREKSPTDRHFIDKSIIEGICDKLEVLMASTDPLVKKGTIELCVEIYQTVYDVIEKYLVNVKPILLKDLRAEFDKHPIRKTAVKTGDLKFDDADWKERLSSMNALKDSLIDPNSFEIINIVGRRLKDANIQVVCAAVECIKNGRIVHLDAVRGMLLRFKDKKPALTSAIKETVLSLEVDPSILIDMLSNKNPEIKIGLLDCLLNYPALSRVREVAVLLDDGNADVRMKSACVLAGSDISDLNEEQRTKVLRLSGGGKTTDAGGDGKGPVAGAGSRASTDTAGSDSLHADCLPSQSSPVRQACADKKTANKKIPGVGASQSLARCESIDAFVEKYPLFQEKDWNKRLEYLRENMHRIKEEPIAVLGEFMLHSRESNFNILKEMLRMFIDHGGQKTITPVLCAYLGSRVGEAKLRGEIIGLYSTLEKNYVVDSILGNMQANPVGKKFIANIEILRQILDAEDQRVTRFIKGTSVSGIQERTALESFKKHYLKLSGKPQCGDARNSTLPSSKAAGTDYRETHTVSRSGSTNKEKSSFVCFKGGIPPKNTECLKEVFTDEFLKLMDDDPYRAIHFLADLDQIAISGVLIRLYSAYCLPSPYFSSLILHFIAHKYILLEGEARSLVAHLLSNAMDKELELLDRIYPATRLYKIYRSFTAASAPEHNIGSAEQILKLVSKYRKVDVRLGRDALVRIVEQNPDFIGLTAAVSVCRNSGGDKNGGVHDPTPRNPSDRPGSAANDQELSDFEDSFVIEDVAVDEIQNSNRSFLKAPSILGGGSCAGTRLPGPRCDAGGLGEDQNNSLSGRQAPADAHGDCPPENRIGNTLLLERSIENISISTTPRKKKKEVSEMEDILGKLIHSDSEISKDAFKRLNDAMANNIDPLVSSSNSVLGSVMVQLFDKFSDDEFRSHILHTLLKLSQNERFCLSLCYETLRSINNDLIRIVSEDIAAADILINFCLNCNVEILRVYFDLLENNNEIILKLIWRHSKKINYSSSEIVASILHIIDSFYQRKGYVLHRAENVVLKVCLLHLKDCCLAYSDGAKNFGVGERTKGIIDLLLSGSELNLEDVRQAFK